ncbi:MAG: hypothetical protein J6125_03465, partial [Clostridia bacterium]|nr:hypothetical protein [Clostridia bacterium]
AYADPAYSAALLRYLHRQADASGLFTLRQTPVSEGPLPDGFPASPRATGQEAAQTPSDTPAAADGSACPPLSSDPASVRPTGASDDNQSLQNDLLPPPPPAVSAPFATDAPAPTEQPSAAPWRLIGVAFDCYLLVECGEELLIIDQHAAHERILFEEMLAARQNGRIASQSLLVGIGIPLAPDLLSVLLDQEADLRSLGYTFRVEDDHTATLTEIPSDMTPDAAAAFFSELAQQMASCGAEPYLCDQKRRERTLSQMACKAAIKGGRTYDHAHLLWLIDRLRELPDITLCPHGRPVAVRLSHRQLDHRFDRL